jgi:hypothetical protein
MQALAAELSGWRPENSAALLREEFKNSLFEFQIFITAARRYVAISISSLFAARSSWKKILR